jgi:hypothetical protein
MLASGENSSLEGPARRDKWTRLAANLVVVIILDWC